MLLITNEKIVKDIMSKQYITIHKDEYIDDAIENMLTNNLKEVFVVDKYNKVIGLLSMTDISKYKKLSKKDEKLVSDIMINNVIYVGKSANIMECRNLMIKHKIGFLPVLESGEIIGVIRQDHIRDYFYMGLERTSETLDNIIKSMKEGVCAIDSDGIVVIWDKSMETMYNIKSSDIVGKSMYDFFENAVTLRVLKTKKAISDVFHSPRKDVDSLVCASPIFIDGDLVGAVCTELDITEVKKLSSELEKANNTLEFLENEMKKISNNSFSNILGKSQGLKKSIEIAQQVSKTNSSIFIYGESGTGKEVFARAIHDYSDRKGLFIAVNCSAIPSELFESEFFGYEPGSFTGANKKGKMGMFELASEGTVFLDEVADLPLHMQAKLLRVLQEKEVRRIGGEKNIPINVRIISATNKNLQELVYNEQFREDLYYRLNVVEIDLPPLRERKEDIGILIHNFLKEICKQNNKLMLKIDNKVVDILENYKWKGNIRELRNTIEHLVVLCTKDIITKELIPSYILKSIEGVSSDKEYPLDLNKAIEQLETDRIKKALEMAQGNKAKASKILNIPRSTLYYKMELYKIR
jgi:transcriptional regulator with PAS, ATPase and Fis domain